MITARSSKLLLNPVTRDITQQNARELGLGDERVM